MAELYGILSIDKPAGITSARVVSHVKRVLPRGTKIGHAGTLDPFATGVLLLLIGRATKLCEQLMESPKQYVTTVRLGATTDTDDLDSPEHPTPNVIYPTIEQIQSTLLQFIGTIQQRPPAYSAMKVGGRRAYALAREGQPVPLAERPVRIDDLRLLSYEPPDVRLQIDCGRGTYIRSIARDLGERLQCGGYLTQLRRTRVGRFTADEALSLEKLSETTLPAHLQGM